MILRDHAYFLTCNSSLSINTRATKPHSTGPYLPDAASQPGRLVGLHIAAGLFSNHL